MDEEAETIEAAQRRHERHLDLAEIIAALVLSVAALLTSWAGFQAALWDGEQAAAYTRAGAARVEASRLAMQNGQLEAVDLFLFSQWLDAVAQEEPRLQAFYHRRFRPAFRPAFDAWIALKPLHNLSAPPTPFAMTDYAMPLRNEAARMEREADRLFSDGERANNISDAFVQATVILALALFLGGIGQTFKRPRVRLALISLAAVACIVGLVQLLQLPALRLTMG
ncbi:hypothetical protein [Edaphosphingomonas haloaromaticamans]|uniref:DUF4337 domain-containing protein n=1 Tax=Edaphosphingomonas haloaromaticamans TaxID=653954 RepID=A0A1S1H994_9SPHN|nr:hypothetical protein [Sphingomonas haloaromaticamans]OHT18645.1 hypothetical protein BHE75_00619 [Sphingomonas haloaromaticamans]